MIVPPVQIMGGRGRVLSQQPSCRGFVSRNCRSSSCACMGVPAGQSGRSGL